MRRREFLRTASATAALSAIGAPVLAQQRVGKIVIGFAPGGAGDTVSRLIAEKLKPAWAANTIVENKPGAGGVLAMDAVRTAEPDGYTLLNSPASLVTILPHTYKSAPPFNPLTDLIPVAGIGELDFGLIVGPASPAKTLNEFIDLVKKNSKQASYGTAGAGSTPHFLGFMIGRSIGAPLSHVAYRGGAPAIQDVMGNQVPSVIGALNEQIIESHKSGALRVLATAGTRRSPLLPNIPTLDESGLKGVSATDWSALFAPGRTPVAELERVARAATAAAADGAYVAAIGRLSMAPMVASPVGELMARVKREYDSWAPIVKATGFTQDA